MKKLLPRLLCLLLVITMLPLSAFALSGMQNHNHPDVTIVKSETDENYYFPDIIKLPDGKLLVCFYQATMHVGTGSYGAIYLTESSDNGETWSTPWKVIDRSAEAKDSRDPNLDILPDGTVILTYFGAGDCKILFSKDGGRSWSKEINVVSDILDNSVAKRGNIAVIDNDNMLVPFYGKSSGSNAYGAPATAEGTNAFGNSWQVDAVIMHYQRQADGNWEVVYESMLGQSIDETGLLFTGKGGDVTIGEDGYPVYEGDVWAFSREDGSVRVSHDNCRTWQLMAKEEPRQYTNEGIILWGEQVIQPRFDKISDDCWFVTYANYSNLNYAHDRVSRPVYGKVFFPEQGWYATQARLIFDGTGHGVSDMADPASIVTDDGRVLVIYYSTTLQAIAGTFTDLEEWVNVSETEEEPTTVERQFWDGSLSSPSMANSIFAVGGLSSATCWNWAGAGVTLTGDAYSDGNAGVPTFTSKETISGDYEVQFDFELRGTSKEVAHNRASDDRDEGIQVFPLFESTNSNIESGKQYRVRISTTHGVSLHYGTNNKGDYGDTIVGMENKTSVGTHSLPATLSADTTYTAKIAKQGDGLFIKVWPKDGSEPGWQAEYHDESIEAEDETSEFKFKLSYVNKVYNRDASDNENVFLSNLSFYEVEQVTWDWEGMFTEDNYFDFVTERSGFLDEKYVSGTSTASADFFTDRDGFKVFKSSYLSTPEIGGDYTFEADITFHEPTDTGDKENGVTMWPQYRGSGQNNYRICLSTLRGLELALGSTSYGPYDNVEKYISKGTVPDGATFTVNNSLNKFEVGKAYTLKFEKAGGTLRVKMWPASEAEPTAWNYEVEDGSLVGSAVPYKFRMYFLDKNSSTNNSMTVDNIDIAGAYDKTTPFWSPFWGGILDSEDNAKGLFDIYEYSNWFIADSTIWQGGGLQSSPADYRIPWIVSKGTISGDYSAQVDFALSGTSTDAASTNKDEGFHIFPMAPGNNPWAGGVLQYRIRMTLENGVQVTHDANRTGIYGGALTPDSGEGLPTTLVRDKTYTLKYSKTGDTLSVKVWEAGTTEPTDWQFVYSADDIDVTTPYYYVMMIRQQGSDDETVTVSNAKFSKFFTSVPMGEISFKEGDKWTFATQTKTDFPTIGKWTAVEDGGIYTNKQKLSLEHPKYISGQYKAQFEFTLDGYSESEDDGLWLFPLDETTNLKARGGTHMIRITANDGIQAFFKGMFNGQRNPELTEVVQKNVSLLPGVPYMAKIAKDYDTLTLKIWEAGTTEPLGWNLVWMDETIGSKVTYERGKYNYPYDHSRYGEAFSEANPYRWKFRIQNVNTAGGTGVTIRDLELYKNVVVETNHTELTVNQGETPKNIEVNTLFYPNIFQQLPTPEGATQYTSENGNVELTPIHHVPGVRIHRANVTGVNVGEDMIVSSYPGIVDSNGETVKAYCKVTVTAANDSDEFKGVEDGYISEVIYEQDFEDVELFENSTIIDKKQNYTVEDVTYNPMSDFFKYQPFYSMSHLGVREDTMTGQDDNGRGVLIQRDNHFLKSFLASGSEHAGSPFRSHERVKGDLTLTADVFLPTTNAEVRINVASQQVWTVPAGEAAAGAKLGNGLTAHQMQDYADYQFGFRQWYIRARLNSAAGIHMYDESKTASGWQSIKVVKAGDTLYAKSWPKGSTEPDWEFIVKDEKLLAAEEKFGGGYITIDLDSGYEQKDLYSMHGEVLLDNLRITRQVKADELEATGKVTLNTNGGTIVEGKDVTEYTEGYSVKLPAVGEITKAGYDFVGWYDNDRLSGLPVEEIPTTATGDVAYYAKWEVSKTPVPDENVVPETPELPVPEEPTVPETPELPVPDGENVIPEKPELPVPEEEEQPNNPAPEKPDAPVPEEPYFTDVRATNSYFDAVQYVAANGLMTGITNTRFGLNYAVNRATLTTVLWRLENEPEVDYDMSYTDVADGEWYTEAIRWATSEGIVNGISETKFSPLAEITKEQLITILYRYAEYREYDTAAGEDIELQFTDASRISAYAVDAMKWACGVGILENSRATIMPKTAVTRGDFAAILMSFCENVIE